jgi:hypothetical protein
MGLLVHCDRRFLRGSVNQTECFAVRAVEPVREELDSVFVLDVEVALVSVFDVLFRDITQIAVNVHEDWHGATLPSSCDVHNQHRRLRSGSRSRKRLGGKCVHFINRESGHEGSIGHRMMRNSR